MHMNKDIVSSIALLALGAIYSVYSLQYKIGDIIYAPGSGAFPLLIGILLMLLSAVLLFLSVKKQRAIKERAAKEAHKFHLNKAFWLTCIGLLIYTFVMPLIGFFLATVILNFYLIRVLGGKGWLVPLVISLALGGLLYWLFGMMLKIPVPTFGI
ncbi:tripartite tricarboxylate transporter TctB family protein [Candidatus Formimonas warabiya]|uniref:DUF1468 domain-containing protein n=1 Tax=Formimonas warabiya TaxID=1761012 RepID=A0A3G1KM24_FORW1|nr:tripartite tricarboxylate transporter TctB family protein [Candidatus Formimonas warabiya]ATW23477.1 hypothetical protein DCMF_00500 [Candidatus Formimonas warabiya]